MRQERQANNVFSQLKSKKILRDYLFNGIENLQAVDFLTTYKKLETVKKALDTKKWRLGSPRIMNDKKELTDFAGADWQKIYYACFVAESNESIAMWSLYGRPWADGVSVRIDSSTFLRWMQESNKTYWYNKETDRYEEINDSELKVVRVAYTNELTKGSVEKISLVCGTEKNTYIDDIFKDSDNYSHEVFAGVIKDLAWAYEKEVRIRADLDVGIEADGIYIDIPNYVIENLVITAGPLFCGNLECRLEEYSRKVYDIAYSCFSGLLHDMPCGEYSELSDSCVDSVCSEIKALQNAQAQMIEVSQIELHKLCGKGEFIFDEAGCLTIGDGEYHFCFTWKNTNLGLMIEGTVKEYQLLKTLPSVNTLLQTAVLKKTITVDTSCVFLAKNSNNRVIAVKFFRVGGIPNTYNMEYKVFMNVSLNVYRKGECDNCAQSEGVLDKTDELCGIWWDINSERCNMTITKENGIYYCVVNWASSACNNSKWTFSGTWDDDKKEVSFNNEKEVEEFYYDDGTVEVLSKYDSGMGSICLKEDFLFWKDHMNTIGCRCKFKKQI